MKIIFTILAALLLTTSMSAQVPEKLSYQAVIRNSNNQLLINQQVGIQISILQGFASGTPVYIETQVPSTNTNGLVSIKIGEGEVFGGDFAAIDWANGPYFIKTETDPTGGTSYTITSTSQLLSVPYALHAKTAENVTGIINETDPVYTSSPAANITSIDITKISNLNGTNTGDQDLSGFLTSETQNLNNVLTQGNDAGASQIKNVANPTEKQDVATKAYVDALITQLSKSGTIAFDIDGNIYPTIRIGSQVWMAENLRTTKYNDGTVIPLITDNTTWENLATPGYCWYNNEVTYANTYGALYNWYTIDTGNLCPLGWHVPTDDEWKELEIVLGMSADDTDNNGYRGVNEGSKLTGNKRLWKEGVLTDNAEFDASGFSALSAGYRIKDRGYFADIKTHTYWWSASVNNYGAPWKRGLVYSLSTIHRISSFKQNGCSVRCVKD